VVRTNAASEGYGGGRIGVRKRAVSIAAGPRARSGKTMSTRTTSRSVTFRHPFFLNGFDALQAAGTYVIDIDEVAIENLSFPAWRRVSTLMQISVHGATESRTIDPAELDEALERDVAGLEPKNLPASLVPGNAKGETAQRVKTRLVRRR
jgi:hypothetical protein